jgi:hypothetical protein
MAAFFTVVMPHTHDVLNHFVPHDNEGITPVILRCHWSVGTEIAVLIGRYPMNLGQIMTHLLQNVVVVDRVDFG